VGGKLCFWAITLLKITPIGGPQVVRFFSSALAKDPLMQTTQTMAVIIDDDPDDLSFIMDTLQSTFTFPLKGFTNSVEADNYVKHNAQAINLVVTDLRMPMLTGFEVLQNIKTNPETSNIDVIVLSTSSNPADIEKAKQLGAGEFITKPNNYGGYVQIIQAIMKMATP
jgi:CheY-like chemotaxis protein